MKIWNLYEKKDEEEDEKEVDAKIDLQVGTKSLFNFTNYQRHSM